jgi:hypothetical protein
MTVKTFAWWILGVGVVLGFGGAGIVGGSGQASAAPQESSVASTGPTASHRAITGSANRAKATPANAHSSARIGGISALVNNLTPTLHPSQSPAIAGTINGQLGADDPDSGVLTYRVTKDPALGSVTVDSDGGYTYDPAEEAHPNGVTDSFDVVVSDAGSGFHIHGLPGLINLLTFGVLGSSGHTATSTVYLEVPPTTATNATPPASADRLRIEDITFAGFFRVPTDLLADDHNATLAYGGAAMASRLVDGQRTFFFTGHRNANDPLVELTAPEFLGNTLATAPVATIRTYWGDIYGGRKVTAEESNPTQANANWTEGLLWDEAAQRLLWSYGNRYAASHQNNPVLGASVLGADGTVTVQGPWRTTSDSQQTRSFALFLSATLSAATGGATIGLGGKMQSINGTASWGPDLHAISSPAPERPGSAVIAAELLANHPITPTDRRTPREADYQVAHNPDGSVDTAGTEPPSGATGFWTELDETTGASFVHTGSGNRSALVYSGTQADGLIWYGPDLEHGVSDGRGYDGKGNHAQGFRPMLWFVAESDLVDSARGLIEPYQVNPYAAIDLTSQFPELAFAAGLSAGQPVFSADESRLYLPILGAEIDNRQPYPIVAVFAIAD